MVTPKGTKSTKESNKDITVRSANGNGNENVMKMKMNKKLQSIYMIDHHPKAKKWIIALSLSDFIKVNSRLNDLALLFLKWFHCPKVSSLSLVHLFLSLHELIREDSSLT